jgi:hypothetical protein
VVPKEAKTVRVTTDLADITVWALSSSTQIFVLEVEEKRQLQVCDSDDRLARFLMKYFIRDHPCHPWFRRKGNHGYHGYHGFGFTLISVDLFA